MQLSLLQFSDFCEHHSPGGGGVDPLPTTHRDSRTTLPQGCVRMFILKLSLIFSFILTFFSIILREQFLIV